MPGLNISINNALPTVSRERLIPHLILSHLILSHQPKPEPKLHGSGIGSIPGPVYIFWSVPAPRAVVQSTFELLSYHTKRHFTFHRPLVLPKYKTTCGTQPKQRIRLWISETQQYRRRNGGTYKATRPLCWLYECPSILTCIFDSTARSHSPLRL